jgi:hypothetical protein
MKERISNVLAWVGFGYPVLLLFAGLVRLITRNRDLLELLGGGRNYEFDDFLISLFIYGASVMVNYLIIGRVWLLPWRDPSD